MYSIHNKKINHIGNLTIINPEKTNQVTTV